MFRGVNLLRSAAAARRGAVAARGYADKAGTPPIQLFGLEGTYASALYTASVKDSSVATTEKTLQNLKQLFKDDPKTEQILLDPSLSHADREGVFKIVSDTLGGDKVFHGFLDVLASNNRLSLLPEVISNFETLANADKGLVEATVTSAKPLDASTLKRLNSAISGSSFVGKGKQLKLENIVRPEIRGGLIVSVGDRTVDLSIASKLQKYNNLLSQAV